MNIGIIGTSEISQTAILPFQTEQFNVTAIASRTYDNALYYAQKYKIDDAYRGYSNIVENPNIDAVYIGLPPLLQEKWIIHALENNKKVIVEKPACLSLSGLKKIEDLQGNLMVLEGIMIRHHPWMSKMKEIINSKEYGKLLKSTTSINMMIPSDMESGFRSNRELGGGVLIDEMPYWISILQETIGLDLNIISMIKNCKDGVTWNAKINGTIQQILIEFICSYENPYAATQLYTFEKAEVSIPNFFRSSMGDYKINIIIDHNEKSEKIVFPPQNYYRNQIQYWCKNNALTQSVNLEKKKLNERVSLYEKIFRMEESND